MSYSFLSGCQVWNISLLFPDMGDGKEVKLQKETEKTALAWHSEIFLKYLGRSVDLLKGRMLHCVGT